MKLTIIGPVYPYRGGIAHFTTLLVKKLEEQGHQVQVISFKKQYPKLFYPGKSDKDYSEGRLKIIADYSLAPLNPISWVKTILNIIKYHPDKVIIQWWTSFWAVAFGFITRRLRKTGILVQYIIHNTFPHEQKKIDKPLSLFALRGAEKFIALSENEREVLKALQIYPMNIEYCPLPIFSAFPVTLLKKDEAKKTLNLPMDKEILLFFGIVRPYKGLANLLHAIHLLKSKGYTNLCLVVAGEFWTAEENYLKDISSLGIDEMILIFNRYIGDDEASRLFKAADLFVAPYISGTQSATIKTAMYFGLPMVITKCVADEMTEGIPGKCLIIEDNSANKIAEAIEIMVNKSKTIGERGQLDDQPSWGRLISVIER